MKARQARDKRAREQAQAELARAAEQRKAAREKVTEQRDRYRALMQRGKPPLSGGQQAGAIALAIAGAISNNPATRAQYWGQVDKLLQTSAREWESQMAKEREAIDVARAGIAEADAVYAEAEASRDAALAASAQRFAEDLERLGAESKDQQTKIGAQMVAPRFRAMQAQAEAAAEEKRHSMRIRESESELKIETLREQGERWRAEQKWQKQKFYSGLKQERLLAAMKADREEEARSAKELKAMEATIRTGMMVDPAKGGDPQRRQMFVSRYAGDQKRVQADQARINAYADSEREFRDYMAALRKAGKVYQGPGGEKMRDATEKRLIARYNKILSNTARAISGAEIKESEIQRIKTQIPEPKSFTDMGSWDYDTMEQVFFGDLANRHDNFLLSIAPLDMPREEVLRRSPTRRWRQTRPAKETPQDKAQRTFLERDPVIRGFGSDLMLDALQEGELTREEADAVVDSLTEASTALPQGAEYDAERAQLDAKAEQFQDAYETATFAGSSTGALERIEQVQQQGTGKTLAPHSELVVEPAYNMVGNRIRLPDGRLVTVDVWRMWENDQYLRRRRAKGQTAQERRKALRQRRQQQKAR